MKDLVYLFIVISEETQRPEEQAMEVDSSENETSKVPNPSAGGDILSEQKAEVKTVEATDQRETGTKSASHADNSGNDALPPISQPEIKGDNAVQTEEVQKAVVIEAKSSELTPSQIARQEQVMQVDEASQESTDTQDSNSENCYW